MRKKAATSYILLWVFPSSEVDRARLAASAKGNPMGEFQVCATVTVTPPDPIWIADEEFAKANSICTGLWFRKTDDSYGILQIFGSNQEESAKEGINEEIHWNGEVERRG